MSENLREKSAFDFHSVLKLTRYMKGHNGYIAGGVFKNIFNNEKIKDVDLFFYHEKDFQEALEVYKVNEGFTKIYENENAVGFHDKTYGVGVDLVRSQYGSPSNMISSFDFTITKFALHLKTIKMEDPPFGVSDEDSYTTELSVVYHQDFFEHLTLRRVVIDNPVVDFPLNTFERIIRYIGYGYQPCKGTKVKIVRMINKEDLPTEDDDLFKGFYNGID